MPVEVDNGWSAYTTSRIYDIESIVSAKLAGSGWRLSVKWKGYPLPTDEPLGKVLAQTNHPDILRDIERCKQEFYATRPTRRTVPKALADPTPPTRVSGRERVDPHRFMFYSNDDCQTRAEREVTHQGMVRYQGKLRAMSTACALCTPDPLVDETGFNLSEAVVSAFSIVAH